MPLKTDGILFELQPRPTKGDDGKPLLYAEPVIKHRFDINDIDDFCAQYRHTSRGEVIRFANLLEEITTMWLRKGYRVETPFGSFAPKLKLIGEHTEPNRVLGMDVVYNGVEYIPSKQFIRDADCSEHGFRKQRACVGNSQMHDTRAMDEALRKSVFHGHITITNFMQWSGLKYHSAKAYLDSLCKGEKPRLSRYKEARSWHYVVLGDSSYI